MLITERINKYKNKYLLLIVIFIFTEIFLRYYFFNYNEKENNYSETTSNIHYTCNDCFTKSKNKYLQDISNFTKGEKYIVQMSDDENKKYRRECIITNWNMIHFTYYFILTLILPELWIELFIVSFIYEIYEYYKYKCHDIADIFYNIIGILLGYYTRKLIKNI